MKRREFLQSAGVIGAATLIGLPEAAGSITVARRLPEGVMIFGTGGAGGKVVRGLIDDGFDPARFAVMDADTGDLAATRAGLQVITGLIGPDRSWITTPEQAIAAENAMCPLLKAARRSVLVAGLGGRMGKLYAHVIACLSHRAARELGRNVELHLVVAMPFAWEPQYRKAWAAQMLLWLQSTGVRLHIVRGPEDVDGSREHEAFLALQRLLTAEALRVANSAERPDSVALRHLFTRDDAERLFG